ncbi:MAG TPA: aspartyl/asparaginyl beta-hydroxylase domain-containing protein [Casimicrobiaceae bacterium]|nr:aspartyl/asparaginyl beta-hydroxylase domain-containing protein [Casimicrobiaceae bacterium]
MNFKGDFQFLGKADISALRERVLAFGENEWNRDAWRRNQFKAHQQTTTIPLIFDEDFRHSQPTARPDYAALREHVAPVLRLIRHHYDQSGELRRLQDANGPAYPVRMLLARLLPGGVIPAHMDRVFSLAHAHRVHVPIVTHDDVKFIIDGRRQPMKEGEVWEINNRRAHEVENASPISRVHMIVDWVIPGERCCCSAHTHPTTPCTPEACRATDFRPVPCDCLH